MRITRIYTGDDEQSHFEDLEVAFSHDTGIFRRTPYLGTDGISIRDVYANNEIDFHPAPRRQFVITLTGAVEVECGDGTTRRFGAGDMMLADDTTGQGHISRTVELPRRFIIVPVSDDFDLDDLRA